MSGSPLPHHRPDRQQLEFMHETLAAARIHLDHALDLIELDQVGPPLDHALRCFAANVKAGVSTFAEFKAGREQG